MVIFEGEKKPLEECKKKLNCRILISLGSFSILYHICEQVKRKLGKEILPSLFSSSFLLIEIKSDSSEIRFHVWRDDRGRYRDRDEGRR